MNQILYPLTSEVFCKLLLDPAPLLKDLSALLFCGSRLCRPAEEERELQSPAFLLFPMQHSIRQKKVFINQLVDYQMFRYMYCKLVKICQVLTSANCECECEQLCTIYNSYIITQSNSTLHSFYSVFITQEVDVYGALLKVAPHYSSTW